MCLNVLFLSYLYPTATYTYKALALEDSWAENLTAVFYFLAGVLLFVAARAKRDRRWLHVLGGIALVFVAGEEISWGQRVLGFGTPGFLHGVNEQEEFNIHNTAIGAFHAILDMGPPTLCAVACAAFFSGRATLFRVPLPSFLLVLGLILMRSHRQTPLGGNLSDIFFHQETLLLLLLVVYALFCRRATLFLATASTASIVLTSAYVYLRSGVVVRNSGVGEVREYLLSIVCLFYALELLQHRRRSGADLAASDVARPRASLCSTVCAFVILCSAGMPIAMYFIPEAARSFMERQYRSILSGASGERVLRADYDLYFDGQRLTYFKDPCVSADGRGRWFLHVVPANEGDLPASRRRLGFENLDQAVVFMVSDGKCIGGAALPRYPVSSIRTGQWVPGEGEVWSVTLPLAE